MIITGETSKRIQRRERRCIEEREEIERNLQELKRMQPNPAEIQRQKMLQMQYEQQQAKEREQKETKSKPEFKT